MSAARGRLRTRAFAAALGVCLTVVLVFLTLPVLAIFVRSPPSELIEALGEPVAREALLLSLETTTIAVAAIVLIGTPAAWLLATRRLPGRDAMLTLIELPLVLPPAVAGIALLAALGPQGILGGLLSDLHIELVLQTAGVVVALAFVASPFYIRQAHASFEAIDRNFLEASADLGAGEPTTLLRVALPIARPGLLVGLALAWGRALGEFGATLMFAGSFAGVTQTAPLAIYDQFATDLPAALALSAVLVAASAVLLGAIKLSGRSSVAAVSPDR
ncbi:MAG TPA: ABC transporter permease [Solirubrobacteraceae bacterium]